MSVRLDDINMNGDIKEETGMGIDCDDENMTQKTHQLCALDKCPSSVHCDERLRKM